MDFKLQKQMPGSEFIDRNNDRRNDNLFFYGLDEEIQSKSFSTTN